MTTIAEGPANTARGGFAIDTLIGDARPTIYAWAVVLLCLVVVIAEGADIVALAVVAPQVASHFGFSPQTIGLLLSISIVGTIGASYLLSPLVDRIGRRKATLAGLLTAAIGTGCGALAPDFTTFLLCRLVAGAGVGLTSAGILSIPSEILAPRFRTTATIIISCGFPIGAGIASMLVGQISSEFGYRSAFYIGAAASMLSLLLCIPLLPESPYFTRDPAALRRLLARIGAQLPPEDGQITLQERQRARNPVGALFTDGRAFVTIALWIVSFCSIAMVYLITTWTPGLLARSGAQSGTALAFYTYFSFVGVAVALVGAWLTSRISPTLVLIGAFAAIIPAALVVLLADGRAFPFFQAFFVVAVLLPGAQFCLIGLLAEYYPSSFRSTGISYGISAGRLGGVLAPVTAGWLTSIGLTINQIIGLCSIPAGIAMVFMIILFRSGRVGLER